MNAPQRSRARRRAARRAAAAAAVLASIAALVLIAHAWLDVEPVSRERASGSRDRAADVEPLPGKAIVAPDEPSFADARRPEPLVPPPAAPDAGRPIVANVAVPSPGTRPHPLSGITVFGKLCDGDGRPCTESVRSLMFDNGGVSPLVPVITGSDYVISGLSRGHWHVRWTAADHGPVDVDVVLAPDVGLVQLDLMAASGPRWSLDILALTPEGEPLGAVAQKSTGRVGSPQEVRFTAIACSASSSMDPPPPGSRADEVRGPCTFREAPKARKDDPKSASDRSGKLGTLRAVGARPAFVSLVAGPLVVQTQRVESDATAVVFTVPVTALAVLLGRVRVRFIGEDTCVVPAQLTAEIAGIELPFAVQDHERTRDKPLDEPLDGRGMLGSDGSITWQRLRPGPTTLVVTAPHYERWSCEVRVPAGGLADLGTVQLTPATRLAGRIVGFDGPAVEGEVRVIRDDLDGASGSVVGPGDGKSGRCDLHRDGRFELAGLGRHRYRVVLIASRYAALPVIADLRTGDVGDVRLVVTPGALVRLRASWPSGPPCDVRLTTADGVLITSWERWRGDATWTGRLPSGALQVSLLRDGRELRRIAFAVRGKDLVVDLAP